MGPTQANHCDGYRQAGDDISVLPVRDHRISDKNSKKGDQQLWGFTKVRYRGRVFVDPGQGSAGGFECRTYQTVVGRTQSQEDTRGQSTRIQHGQQDPCSRADDGYRSLEERHYSSPGQSDGTGRKPRRPGA